MPPVPFMKLNIHLHAPRAADKTHWPVRRRTRIKTTRRLLLLLSLQQTQRRICMRRHLSSRLLYVFSTRLRRRDVSSAARGGIVGGETEDNQACILKNVTGCSVEKETFIHLFIYFIFRTSVKLPPSSAPFAILRIDGLFSAAD